MSTHHVAWAMDQTTGSPSRKAVLVALAEYANGTTGKCFPHVATIAKRTELSEATVKRALFDLALDGYFTRTRDRRPDGTQGGYHYQLPLVRVEAVTTSDPGVTVTPDPGITVTPHEPGTSLEPIPPVSPPVRKSWSVDRQRVTQVEEDLARQVLGSWNELTGQSLSATDHLGKIVMRLREHPDRMTVNDHHVMILALLGGPKWWEGAPSLSMIYGNAAQFERQIEATRDYIRKQSGESPPDRKDMRYGRGMTTRQMLDTIGGET